MVYSSDLNSDEALPISRIGRLGLTLDNFRLLATLRTLSETTSLLGTNILQRMRQPLLIAEPIITWLYRTSGRGFESRAAMRCVITLVDLIDLVSGSLSAIVRSVSEERTSLFRTEPD